jgi:hypothetical protein
MEQAFSRAMCLLPLRALFLLVVFAPEQASMAAGPSDAVCSDVAEVAGRSSGNKRGAPVRNLRAVQLLLGHTKIESTVRYLGIEVDDAIAIAEQVDV